MRSGAVFMTAIRPILNHDTAILLTDPILVCPERLKREQGGFLIAQISQRIR